jgi:hypothetical protein
VTHSNLNLRLNRPGTRTLCRPVGAVNRLHVVAAQTSEAQRPFDIEREFFPRPIADVREATSGALNDSCTSDNGRIRGPSNDLDYGRLSLGETVTVAQRDPEDDVNNVERQLTTIEQILPTLAMKVDLEAAIAPLATKEQVRVEGIESNRTPCDARHREAANVLSQHDRRITALETSRPKQR